MVMTITAGPRRAVAVCLAGVLSLSLAACGWVSESEANEVAVRERTARADVPHKSCAEVACQGELDGAAYDVWVPQRWNGTLLLYSHGYRSAKPAPPDFAPVQDNPTAAPTPEVARLLLEQGYALAGSAYKANGWAVAEGVTAGEKLHDWFADNVGQPDRVYVWGDSLGGLITQLLAERHPDWVTGAAPFCGALAGGNRNLDLGLDLAYAVKTLIYPQLKLTGFASNAEAVANWQGAYNAIVAAARDTARGVPKLLMVAAVTDVSARTKTYDGSTPESLVRGYAEATLTGLSYATMGRYEIEQRVGGNPSTNADANYAARVSAAERSLIESVSPGATDTLVAALAAGQRVSADSAARRALDALGQPTGAIHDPTITLHTTADPLVLAQNETVFANQANSNAQRTGDFVQLYIAPPPKYPQSPGAPYGAGHCNFTTQERLAMIKLLDEWARVGTYPQGPAITAAFGEDPGLRTQYDPGPWPSEAQ
jgi:pimeloyl-ACP methyl ester carboxylesterase